MLVTGSDMFPAASRATTDRWWVPSRPTRSAVKIAPHAISSPPSNEHSATAPGSTSMPHSGCTSRSGVRGGVTSGDGGCARVELVGAGGRRRSCSRPRRRRPRRPRGRRRPGARAWRSPSHSIGGRPVERAPGGRARLVGERTTRAWGRCLGDSGDGGEGGGVGRHAVELERGDDRGPFVADRVDRPHLEGVDPVGLARLRSAVSDPAQGAQGPSSTRHQAVASASTVKRPRGRVVVAVRRRARP